MRSTSMMIDCEIIHMPGKEDRMIDHMDGKHTKISL